MTRTKRIIYWVATVWLALGMTSTAIVQLMQLKEETEVITAMGYPLYLLRLLGFAKLLGVIAVLIPRFPLLKEWAYAGFFFMMAGAAYSHIAAGHEATELIGPLLLIALTLVSWYFRPENRRLTFVRTA